MQTLVRFYNLAHNGCRAQFARLCKLHLQAAVSGMLLNTPSSFFEETIMSLKAGAELCFERVQRIKGLHCPTKPQGAMYIMV